MKAIWSPILHVATVTLLAGATFAASPAAAKTVSCPTVDQMTGAVSPPPTQGVDWSGCNLTNAALGDFDLTGANFSGANLTGASFRLATMININLSDATLAGTSFNSVILTDGDLANATVTSDDFTDAALAGTNLTGVDLSAANLDGVRSGGISEGPSGVPAGWRFTVGYLVGAAADLFDANLTGGNLSGLHLAGLSLTGADLTDANLAGTDLSGASLWKADLTGADLAGAVVPNANFQQSVLTGTNLSGVDLSTVILAFVRSGGISRLHAPAALPKNWKFVVGYLIGPNADLDGGNLTGANLSGMDLADTTMNGANLARANLNGAQMALTSLWAVRSGGVTGQPASLPTGFVVKYGYILGTGVDLDAANLTGRDLGDLDLSLATLTGADLAGAGLAGTNLGGSDLVGANLQGASFGGTNLLEAVLTGDNLAGLTLVNSNLSLAILRHVNLTGANLSGDELTGADLTGATLTRLRSGRITGAPSYLPAHWSTYYGYLLGPKAGLAGANLRGDFLFNLDLAGAILTDANLSGANVRGSELAGAHLAHANFSGADLTGAELNATDAYLTDVSWAGATCPDGRKAGTAGCFPANSKPQPVPQISLSLRVGRPASAIRVTGSGFEPREGVAIFFGLRFATATRTTATGRLEPVTVTVPQQARPRVAKISATATPIGQSASAWFTVQDVWAQSRFGPTLDGDNGYENTLTPATVGGLRTKWTFNPAAIEAQPPAVANGRAYVPTLDGHLYARDATTGRKIWTWSVPGAPIPHVELTTPAVAGNTVYESGGGFLYAIGPGGNEEWKYAPPFPAGASAGSAPTVQGAVVYYTAGNVSAVNASSGRQLWSVNPTSESGCGGQPAVSDGVVYVSCADGNLYALSAANGATRWTYSNNGTDLMSPAVAGGVVYAGEALGDVVHAISTRSHAQVWSYTTGGRIATIPAVANGTVYVSSFDDNLYALNAATGAKNWAFTLGTIPFALSPAVAGRVVYVTSSNEIIYGLNAATGAKLWSYSKGNVLQTGPVVANGTVYVGTGSGGLYAFGLAAPSGLGKGQR